MPNPDKQLFDVVLLDELGHLTNIVTTEPLPYNDAIDVAKLLVSRTGLDYHLVEELNLADEQSFPNWSVREH